MKFIFNDLSTWIFPGISLLTLFFSKLIYSSLLDMEGNPEINLNLIHYNRMYNILSKLFSFIMYSIFSIFAFEIFSDSEMEIDGLYGLISIVLFTWISYDSIKTYCKGTRNKSLYLNNTSILAKYTLKVLTRTLISINILVIIFVLFGKMNIINELINNIISISSLRNLLIVFYIYIFFYYKNLIEPTKIFLKNQDNNEDDGILHGVRIAIMEMIFSLLIVFIAFNWNKTLDNITLFLYYIISTAILFLILTAPLIEKNGESIYLIQILDSEKKNFKEIYGNKIINKDGLVIIEEYINFDKGITRPVIYNSEYIYKIIILNQEHIKLLDTFIKT